MVVGEVDAPGYIYFGAVSARTQVSETSVRKKMKELRTAAVVYNGSA